MTFVTISLRGTKDMVDGGGDGGALGPSDSIAVGMLLEFDCG
jgi:hypothetical protein